MANPNITFGLTLLTALRDFGLRDVCVSPGSRNTPILAALAASSLRSWIHHDERSAAFFALGLARASDRPVAIVCTSGTAAAEYHPAVIEARYGYVPLIVITADRPAELRGVGAPQTIDQIRLYGEAVKWFADAPAPTGVADPAGELAVRAWSEATRQPAGPVHLNLPFREPLLTGGGEPQPLDTLSLPAVSPNEIPVDEIAAAVSGRRGMIIAGRAYEPDLASACAALATATGFPVLADPLSGMRHGLDDPSVVVRTADLLASAGALDLNPPEVLLRLGPVPTSKPIWRWMERHHTIPQVLIDSATRDATRSASLLVPAAPAAAAAALTGVGIEPADASWAQWWRLSDDRAAAAAHRVVDEAPFPNEPAVAATVTSRAPEGSIITIGSSMPIRDVDAFGGADGRRIRLTGNRGANGIDGLVSAALGATASGASGIALLGDVSLLNDLAALVTARRFDLDLTIVVVNNDGGGIFHFLPQADPDTLDPAAFERFLVTPHGVDFVPIASSMGLAAETIDDRSALAAVVANPDGPRLVQIETNRIANVALHHKVIAAVRTTLDDSGKSAE